MKTPTMVCTRIVANVLRELVDKANVDNINAGIGANLSESDLRVTLSPVHCDVLLGSMVESSKNGRGENAECNSGAGKCRERHGYRISRI